MPDPYGEFYSSLYSAINIQALKAITDIDWKSRPIAVQAKAESILFLVADTLHLMRSAWNIDALNQRLGLNILNIKSLYTFCRFDAYCQLFQTECAEKLIERARNSRPDKQSFSVSLNALSENAVIFHNLALEIEYISGHNCYELKFPLRHSIDDLLNEEKQICQKN